MVFRFSEGVPDAFGIITRWARARLWVAMPITDIVQSLLVPIINFLLLPYGIWYVQRAGPEVGFTWPCRHLHIYLGGGKSGKQLTARLAMKPPLLLVFAEVA